MTTHEQERKEHRHIIMICKENIEEVDKAVRGVVNRGKSAASSAGETVKDTIHSVRATRDSVVMMRVTKESLSKLDELVDSGLSSSRSEAAAFMIAEGIKAKSDLFDKIAEKTEVIRSARDELRRLLDDDEPVSDQQPED